MRRREFMRQVIMVAQRTGDAVAPWDGVEVADQPMERHFSDEAELLVELHREWLRLLVGRLHRGEIVAQRSPANVRDLYDELCADHPTLRGILDAHAVEPALWEPTAREHAMLARISGLAEHDAEVEQAAAHGRALVHERIPVQRSTLLR